MPSERWRWVLLLAAMLTIASLILTPTESASVSVQKFPESPKTVIEQTREVPERKNDAPQAVLTSVNLRNDNVVLGESIARQHGIEGNQWQCLYELGMRESGWDNTATNPTSGAYGIPQSLPASKMASHGDIHDPRVQIEWFIDYVERRYGTPCNAYQFQITNNWY